jgi:hypothetical protein
MLGRRAEGCLQGNPALQPDVKVVLPGESDPAVALQGCGVRDRLGVAGGDLRNARRARGVLVPRGVGVRRVPSGRTRGFDRDVCARELVLHGLERAHRLPELLAVAGVLDGHLEQSHRDAILYGGDRGGRARAGFVDREALAALGLDGEKRPRRVLRGDGARAEIVAGKEARAGRVEHEQEVGGACVGHERVGFESDRGRHLTACDTRQPRFLERIGRAQRDQARGRRRLCERLGQRGPARFFQHEDEVDLVPSGTAVLFGDEHS